MNGDKGLSTLRGEPLVGHVVRRIAGLVDEVVVVVGSEKQEGEYSQVLDDGIQLLVDVDEVGSPLVGAITGLECIRGSCALITGCDVPFILPEAVSMLFGECEGFDGATFQWPNGWIEPLLSVYRVEPALRLALEAYDREDHRLRTVLHSLPHLKLIPIKALRIIDPQLLSLWDVDTREDLAKAEETLERMEKRKNNHKKAVNGALGRPLRF
jgi:molybdopterin-guanine dinucleotide biosynthesis protein A